MEIKSDKSRLDIISQVKHLLLIDDGEKDSLLNALLDNAYEFAIVYCAKDVIPSGILCRMVCEDFARPSGIKKKSRASMSEEYESGYSSTVRTLLNGMRRLKTV
jgi:hypothetical protein